MRLLLLCFCFPSIYMEKGSVCTCQAAARERRELRCPLNRVLAYFRVLALSHRALFCKKKNFKNFKDWHGAFIANLFIHNIFNTNVHLHHYNATKITLEMQLWMSIYPPSSKCRLIQFKNVYPPSSKMYTLLVQECILVQFKNVYPPSSKMNTSLVQKCILIQLNQCIPIQFKNVYPPSSKMYTCIVQPMYTDLV